MSYATIDLLRSQLGSAQQSHVSEAYAKKQLHAIPEAKELDRVAFILEHVKGKRVLEFGASGPMHDAIVKAAKACAGVDREDAPGVMGFDLDDVSRQDLPQSDEPVDLIVCGEVIEHLSNPGWFLTRLKRQFSGVPVLITVPNAYAAGGIKSVQAGTENVNIDHVAWYSYRTLRTLLERAGYSMTLAGWYNGTPRLAEGLIVIAE
jgi:2-polyprenyl-3-methyl-5-hydroxy-6-metoxy-1,4-benzoquinol methylase